MKKLYSSALLLVMSSSNFYLDARTYWYGGYTTITSVNPDLTYKLYKWESSANGFIKKGQAFPVNKTMTFEQVLGDNLDDCPKMDWYGTGGASIVLVPNLPYSPSEEALKDPSKQDAEAAQQLADLRSAKYHPYIVVHRFEKLISIYIIGPTQDYPYQAEKIEFNIGTFERSISNIIKVTTLIYGINNFVIACSFDADTGTFFDYQNQKVNNSAFYLFAVANKNSVLGCNCNLQYDARKNICGGYSPICSSQQDLINKGILTYTKNVDICEIKYFIDFINMTNTGNLKSPQLSKAVCPNI